MSFLLSSYSCFWSSYGLEKASPRRVKQNSEQRKICRKKHKKRRASNKEQKLSHYINVQKRNTGCEADERAGEQHRRSSRAAR